MPTNVGAAVQTKKKFCVSSSPGLQRTVFMEKHIKSTAISFARYVKWTTLLYGWKVEIHFAPSYWSLAVMGPSTVRLSLGNNFLAGPALCTKWYEPPIPFRELQISFWVDTNLKMGEERSRWLARIQKGGWDPVAPRLTNGGAGPHQSGRGGFFMSQAGASVKRVSPSPQGKHRTNPILVSVPLVASSWLFKKKWCILCKKVLVLGVVQWVPKLFLIGNTLFKEIFTWSPK